MISGEVLVGIGFGIWAGYFLPRINEIVELFRNCPTIMSTPPMSFTVVYYIGLLLVSVATAMTDYIGWGWFIAINGIIFPLSMMYIIPANMFDEPTGEKANELER